MADQEPLPIADLTFDALVDALVVGEPVLISGSDETFQLEVESRVALAFYRKDLRYWGKYNVTGKEVEQLLDALKSGKTTARTRSSAPHTSLCRWRLRKLTAHRFAGLHHHCSPENGSPPPPFEWEFDKDLTLVWGFNGAGKSSMLSAVTWCLTGRALRSHKMPELVHDPMIVEVPGEDAEAGEADENGEAQSATETFPIPPVVPIPTTAELEALGDEPVTDDTWVELAFEPEGGGNPIRVKRSLTKTKAGKYKADVTGLESLGLTDLALHVGTIMPSIAAQMRFDEPTELGKAVAELTGLKPFFDFGKRCPKVIERLTGREMEESDERKAKCLASFQDKLDHYNDSVASHPTLKPSDELTLPGAAAEPGCRERIVAAKAVATTASEQMLACFDEILRTRPALDDEAKVDTLLTAIDNATKVLAGAELKILPTAQTRLGPIKVLSESAADIDAAETLVANIVFEANDLANRLAEAEKAKRWQLYARVAQWHQHHHEGEPFERCPVCSTSLLDVPADATLDRGVAAALEECRESAAYLTRTAEEWEKEKAEALLAALPRSVLNVIDHDWSKGLPSLYEKALISELFGKAEFARVLSPVAQNAAALWNDLAKSLTGWTAPQSPKLPTAFPTTHGLEATLGKLSTALALARFRHEHADAFDAIIPTIIGKPQNASEQNLEAEEDLTKAPVLRQLFLLRQAASAARPAAKAINLLDHLADLLGKWEAEGAHVQALNKAATALRPFCRFPELVEGQVTGLLKDLAQGTKTWVGRIYRPHYLGGPGFAGFGEADGTALDLKAVFGGTIAPAHQVLNSSALRAHVWGFLLALWDRVWISRGGLSCVLLDDPQSLFDAMNAENMAAVLPTMLSASMCPIVASNDNHFVAMATSYLRGNNVLGRSALLQLSPISSSKLAASLVPLIEKVREERARWREDENDVAKAQAFVEPVRAHVETRLWDLLASDPKPLFKPTLADLLGRIANARNTGQKPFNEEPFRLLLAHTALQPDSDFYKVVNKAHHRPREISPVDAKVIDGHFNGVEDLIDACAATYARFLGRLPDDRHAATPTSPPAPPACQPLAAQPLRVLPPLAARMDFTVISEAETSVELWDPAELSDVALFGVGAHTLGAACLMGQTAIVDPSVDPKRGDLVICQKGTSFFARRLGLDRDDPARLILETIPSATNWLPPTHIVPRYASRVMKIVGVLFDQNLGLRGEACPVEVSDVLRSVRAVSPVVGASAYPVAPDGSRVLLTPVDSLDESQITVLNGRIVAVAATDSPETPDLCAGYLKRLGPSLAGFPAVRILENIGSIGDSVYVHFPSVGATPSDGIASVRQIWRVSGVLY